MTWERALEADARLAAKNAVLIRAALRQSFDPERAFIGYQNTMPDDTLTLTQQRVRARAWAIMNIRPNLEPFRQVLYKVWAEGYALGDTAAREAVTEAKEAQKADVSGAVDWSKWKPGDAVAALLLKPPRAFQRLIEGAGITLKGFSDTTLTDIGNSIGEAIELGIDARAAAKTIMRHVASPSRALMIAITEQNRAISNATINRYREAGLSEHEWLVFEPCEICAKNENVKVSIGAPFPSGDTQPPAHPNCRCALAPVIPGMDDPANTAGSMGIMPPPTREGFDPIPYTLMPSKLQDDFSIFDTVPEKTRAVIRETLEQSFAKAAKQNILIHLPAFRMQLILEEGRFKSAFEAPRAFGGKKEYMQERSEIETDYIGIPQATPDSNHPIYGLVYGDGGAYGAVRVKLKNRVKGRASLSAGDSFARQNPIKITDILEGKATINDYTRATQKGMFGELIRKSDVPLTPERLEEYMKFFYYWEVQIHGGVTLDDIESVLIDPKDFDGMALVPELEKRGIKVEIQALYR